jgi:hypothetical protein
MAVVEALSHDVDDRWEQLPDGLVHSDVSAVAVDSEDGVFLLTRKTTIGSSSTHRLAGLCSA